MIGYLKNLARNAFDRIGIRTDVKFVVFCSDDWGGIRIRSTSERDALMKAGIDMDSNRFDKYDCLESNRDLERLFEILLKYRDRQGRHPIFTAVMNVANPDFKKIYDSGYQKYFYEPFTETLKRYPNHDKVLAYIKSGIDNKIFQPEYHGREHLQTRWWMSELRYGGKLVSEAFKHEYFMLSGKYLEDVRFRGLGAAFDVVDEEDISLQKDIINDGLKLFEQIFGYKSCYFTAPSMHYNYQLEEVLHSNEVVWLDVAKIRLMPIRTNTTSLRLHYLGQRNKYRQRYLVRNAVFEANMDGGGDGVDLCLRRIADSFNNKKPAIISNHRASFVGGINDENSIKGVEALDKLLSSILKKWPDVVFASVRDLNHLL